MPVRFKNQQLTLWYGTPDAPAPLDGKIEARRGVVVAVGVQPAHPCNAVTVRYCVDEGLIQSIRAVRVRTDVAQGIDYFRAVFPDFWTGEHVAYLPMVTCSGRTAPDPAMATTFPSAFRLGGPISAERLVNDAPKEPATPWTPPVDRLPFSLDYLASVHVPIKEPETISETPEGVMVNWFWATGEGVVAGPKLNAKIRQLDGDWMRVRRDGVGVMSVRATIETCDGALVFVNDVGHYELGERGYQDFLARRWPARIPTRTTPRLHTAHPQYLWLNRIQCVAIGELQMRQLAYTYDLYGVGEVQAEA
jgi:Protein of unknown function (DUF3237)